MRSLSLSFFLHLFLLSLIYLSSCRFLTHLGWCTRKQDEVRRVENLALCCCFLESVNIKLSVLHRCLHWHFVSWVTCGSAGAPIFCLPWGPRQLECISIPHFPALGKLALPLTSLRWDLIVFTLSQASWMRSKKNAHGLSHTWPRSACLLLWQFFQGTGCSGQPPILHPTVKPASRHIFFTLDIHRWGTCLVSPKLHRAPRPLFGGPSKLLPRLGLRDWCPHPLPHREPLCFKISSVFYFQIPVLSFPLRGWEV